MITDDISSTLSDIEATLDDNVRAYSRASCRALATYTLDKLPRELRDMIYDHMFGGKGAWGLNYQKTAFYYRGVESCNPIMSRQFLGEHFFAELIDRHNEQVLKGRFVPQFQAME